MNIVETELLIAERAVCGYVCYKCTFQYKKWRSFNTKKDFLNHIKRPIHLNHKDPNIPSITTMYKKYSKYPLHVIQDYINLDNDVIRYFYHTRHRNRNRQYYINHKTDYLGDKDEKDYDIEKIKGVYDIYEITDEESYKYEIINRLVKIAKYQTKQSHLWCKDVAGIIAEYI